jgi:hypothetical protein
MVEDQDHYQINIIEKINSNLNKYNTQTCFSK